ncbi:MAG: flagellar assembly protein FliW [Myxococcales bacterium]|nr:flagellar assembly protein FliW [Myxococcales bacterium]
MLVEGTRFGRIEFDDDKVIVLRGGLLGFPQLERYVLHEQERVQHIAWLQSIERPDLAFPVMDAASFGAGYPDPSPADLARSAGLSTGDLAVLVVVVARRAPPTLMANMLAPLIIDVASRTGVQVVLDPQRFSASHVLDGFSTMPRTGLEALSQGAFAATP